MPIQKRSWKDPAGKQKVRYDVQVRKRGAPRLFKTFTTRAAAESWERGQINEIERGSWRPSRQAEMMTLADALDRYVQEVLPEKKSSGWVESMSRTIMEDQIVRLPLIGLGSDDLAAYRDRRSKARARGAITQGSGSARQTKIVRLDRQVSPETVRKELALIRRAINHVRREAGVHLAAGNPVDLVRQPKPSRGRDRRLNAGEEFQLLKAAEVNPMDPGGSHARTRWLSPIIIFALETGARRGEICSIDWKDVDLKRRIATFRDTKNGENRTIPLSTRAISTIQTLPKPTKGGKVFPLTPNALAQQWKRLVKRANVQDLHFHDLRHEAVSRLFEKGLNPVEVSSVSGHKTLQMLKRYTHLRPEELAEKLR